MRRMISTYSLSLNQIALPPKKKSESLSRAIPDPLSIRFFKQSKRKTQIVMRAHLPLLTTSDLRLMLRPPKTHLRISINTWMKMMTWWVHRLSTFPIPVFFQIIMKMIWKISRQTHCRMNLAAKAALYSKDSFLKKKMKKGS